MVIALSFGVIGIAKAVSATSGSIYWVPDTNNAYGCISTYVSSTVRAASGLTLNIGSIRAVKCSNHSVSAPLPNNWLAIYSNGYKNGVFCGEDISYSWTTMSGWTYENSYCSNTSGSQTFKTNVSGGVWNGTGYQWHGWQPSPNVVD